MILNRVKDYYESNKELLREREQKISIENYLKNKKNIKREYGKIDIICLKRKSKN